MRRIAIGVTWAMVMGLAFFGGRATADGEIPNFAYVRDASGAVYIVYGGYRANVAIYPATDEQIAALPLIPKWMSPKADGTGTEMTDQPPSWATQQPQAAAATSAESPISFSGTSMQQTRAFGLAGGNYTVHWSAKANNSIGSCYMGASLKSASSNGSKLLVNEALQNGRTGGADTQLYRLAAGNDYYFDVNSSCAWDISIAPQ